ncbi:hypothetical protein [Rhizobium ruizarguesonis]|uniref:hypothetical protein n=1 Tax=Rhizobium ruizarguesonis TaxID=2081791 RepID=UPI0013DF5046|nr:hypothetical protein [Rhizobium ruizarguesonis]NEJ94340.1 hypothetical protein [Rhizobium ruizarguesonis]
MRQLLLYLVVALLTGVAIASANQMSGNLKVGIPALSRTVKAVPMAATYFKDEFKGANIVQAQADSARVPCQKGKACCGKSGACPQ